MSKRTIPAEQIALRIRHFRDEKGLGMFISFPLSLLAIAGSYRFFQPATA